MSRLIRATIPLLILCASAPPVVSEAWAQGRSMTWLGEVKDLSFSCEDLPPTSTLVVRFTVPEEVQNVERVEAFIDYCTNPHDLPPWWRFDGSSCRAGALQPSAAYPEATPSSVVDLWQGEATVESTYNTGSNAHTDMARLYVNVQSTAENPLPVEEGKTYHAFTVEFDNSDTSCEGCQTPVCIIINGLALVHEGGTRTYMGRSMGQFDYDDYVTWQGGSSQCPFIVPVTPTTWGGIKARWQ